MTSSSIRSGSANTYDTAVRNISMRQNALSTLQENLTSGKKIVRASDDPTGAASAERALTRISRIAADQRALESQRNAIAMAEGTLGDITESLQEFRELVVSAGNGTFSAAERLSVAGQLSGLRDQILNLANRKDTNGLPLFSGLGSALTPFTGPQATAPDYTFQGLPGQSSTSDVAIPSTLDGDNAFMLQLGRDQAFNVKTSALLPGAFPRQFPLGTSAVTITNPNLVTSDSYSITINNVTVGPLVGTGVATYTITGSPSGYTETTNSAPFNSSLPISLPIPDPNGLTVPGGITPIGMPGLSLSITGDIRIGDTFQFKSEPSVFSVLDSAIRDVSNAQSSANVRQAVDQALNNIDIGMGRISAVRGQAGDLLNRADRISGNQEKRSIQLESDRSRAEDMDMLQGISDFNNKQTGYQAALQTYAQVQKISLFNYLS